MFAPHMFAHLSADTDRIQAYGSASADHAADLQTAHARLSTLGATCASTSASAPASTPASASASTFGPVGARFQAALARAAESEAHRVAELGVSVAAAQPAASSVARAYAAADADAGTRITGNW